MKTALVTTTINVPRVLRLYRRCDPEVRFFIAADLKTPWQKLVEFCGEVGNTDCFMEGAEWKCSTLLSWNCIQRRDIATLEALKWGADLIVFVDDDTFPLNTEFFEYFREAFGVHNGLLASPEIEWFDVGEFLDPESPHRGFPHEWNNRRPRLSHVVDAKIGAAAGIVMGDPDVSAVTRIARHPEVLRVSPLLGAGIAVNPKFTRTVFNTQCSAVIRELVPAMLLCPQFKRYDDIIASLVCQRVMVEHGYCVRFGMPFTWQNRNAHDLSRDLADEAWGNANILDVQIILWRTVLASGMTITNKIILLYEALDTLMPGVAELAHAWVDDCERAMG